MEEGNSESTCYQNQSHANCEIATESLLASFLLPVFYFCLDGNLDGTAASNEFP